MSGFATMSDVLDSKKFKETKKAPKLKLPEVETAAYIPLPSETTEEKRKALREEEKSIMTRRKQTKTILEDWDPSLVGTHAREGFEADMKRDNEELRKIRKKLGK